MLSRGLVAGLLAALIGCGSTGSVSECGSAEDGLYDGSWSEWGGCDFPIEQ